MAGKTLRFDMMTGRFWCNDRIIEILTGAKRAVPPPVDPVDELLANPQEFVARVRALRVENERCQRYIHAVEPLVDFADKALNTHGLVDLGTAALLWNLPYGRNTLFQKLRELGILTEKNLPAAPYRAHFRVKQVWAKGGPWMVAKPLLTQAGLLWLGNRLAVK